MHQIPALLLQLHLLGERARVCLCVSPSCWTSSRPPPIYREACSGTRARTLSAAGARGGEITVSAGVVGESCARSAYVTTLYLRGKVWVLCADVHRWGQIRCVTAGDVHCSVCVAGKVGAGSLVCLVCGFVWITSSCMRACVRACVGRMGGWRGFHWMSQSLLGNGWWKHLWAVCHLLLLPLLLLMVSSLCSVESPGAPSCSPGKLNRKSDDPCFTSLLKVKVKQPSIANRGSAPFHGRSPHATTEESEPSYRERLQSKKRVFKSEINPASSFGIIRKAGLFLDFCRFSQVSVMATPSSLFVSERRCCLLPPNIS